MRWFEINKITLYPDNLPYSPGLNLIQHILGHMKHKLHVMYRDIATMAEKPETIEARLAEMLLHIWDEIDKRLFESMMENMPKRVQVIFDAKGRNMKYWGSQGGS